ncbi:hypothetical protein Tco_0990442 [Tanacetum coccineum]|uniref:Uncharacterized protein n=1 Tax=Tanacetum coccineum TaxID=301880 RepID=A0ABQ5EX52_9ASTR
MPLTFQPHSLKERLGLGIMKHTKLETHDSSNKSVSGTVTVRETKQTTPLVPTEVKDTEQESKLNELAKLVKMLIDEKVNSIQKTQESNSKIQKTKSSKSVDSSKIMIAPNEPEIPHTKDTKGLPDLINTKGTHEQNVQNDQMITQPTNVPSGNNTEDRWSRDQHIELVNIIGDPGKGMLTRSMAAKFTTASTSECLFADFLSEIEPKKVSEALKHPG